MINGVAQPIFTEITDDKERQRIVLRKMIRFAAFVSFPVMLGLAFIARELIVVAVGDKWLPSVPILQLFCVWGTVSPVQLLYSQLAIAYGRSDFYMRSHIFIGILQLVVALAMLRFGVIWMVLANVLIYTFVWTLIWQWYINRLIGIRLGDLLRDICPYGGGAIFVFACVYCLTGSIGNLYLSLVAKIVLSVLFYVAIMYFSKSVIFKEVVEFILKRK